MRWHFEYRKLAAVYRDLDLVARAEVDAHLRECPGCAASLAGYERVDQSLQALPDMRLPAGLQRAWPRLLAARVSAEADRRSHKGLGLAFMRALLPVSLIAVLVASVSLILWSVAGNNSVVTVTPTQTFTPTATTVAFLNTDGDPVARGIPSVAITQHAPLPLPAPSPSMMVERVAVDTAFRAP